MPSDAQCKAIAIIPHFTGMISMIASSVLIFEGWHDRTASRGNAISRAVVALGVFDLVSSFGWFLSTWMAPEGTAFYAFGNETTTLVQAILIHFSVVSILYNGILVVFFMLVICWNWSNESLRKVEPWAHAFVWIMFMVAAMAAVYFGPSEFDTWVIDHPFYICHQGGKEATRAELSRDLLAVAPALVIVFSGFLLQITGLILISRKVRSVHGRMGRYSLGSTDIQLRRRSSQDISKVSFQAMLYSLAFFATWTPVSIMLVAAQFGFKSYWLLLLNVLLEPLQGLWNLLIFVRTRPDSKQFYWQLFCGKCHEWREARDERRMAACPEDAARTLEVVDN